MRRQIVSTMYNNDVNKQSNTSAYAFYFFFLNVLCLLQVLKCLRNNCQYHLHEDK